LAHNKVFRAQEEEAFYSSVLTLNIDGKKESVLIKDMQRHPFKPLIMHLDFLRVNAKTEITTSVPLHFLNEEAVEKKGGLISRLVNEIAITCLPAKLPEYIEVDLADLEVGETIHLSQIALPKGVVSDDLSKGEEHDLAVVSSHMPKGTVADEAEDAAAESTEE
jgi:large subunit ribosomal protein L25